MKYIIDDTFAFTLRFNLYNKSFSQINSANSLWKSMRFPLRDILLNQLTISIGNELGVETKGKT
jgi:hypothetical protein